MLIISNTIWTFTLRFFFINLSMTPFLLFVLSLVTGITTSTSIVAKNSHPSKIEEAKAFCKANGLDTTMCIFIDMSIPSGKNRLFLYQFASDSILSEGLCSHGCCDGPWGLDYTRTKPKFSNVHESHCSSLGKYKIGQRGYSNWGIHINYKLHGLQSSNSNAYARTIVLHSWMMIPKHETYPDGCPEGWGCPAVSNEQMKYLDKILSENNSPMLLWIYKR